MLTLGIAGHVDHGKTALTHALTGIDTDRLPEEKRRGISIELGFAWLDFPGQERVALIDMPGHERFVRRMIAGASGVDALLLIVAADEGVMPQGREHLAIASLLGIDRGAVVLTKTDLCDADMLDLAREDVRSLVAGTFLEKAPVWPVSVRQPDSVTELRALLGQFCASLVTDSARAADQQLRSARPFRMAVDRAFSLPGRGTIVGGTALAGHVEVEQLVQSLPGGQTWRIRSLQRHAVAVQRMHAPGRVALNLAGAALTDVPVGTVLAAPGSVPLTTRIDVELTLLPHSKPLLNRRKAMIQLGTTMCEGTVALLDAEVLEPGRKALAQVSLEVALPVWAGQGFVLRGARTDPRFGQTLAGGRVLHPTPARHRRKDAWVLSALGRLGEHAPEMQVLGALQLAQGRGLNDEELQRLCQSRPAELNKAIKQLASAGDLRRAGLPSRWHLRQDLDRVSNEILSHLKAFHAAHPTRQGPELGELAALAAPWQAQSVIADLLASLVRDGKCAQTKMVFGLPGHVPATQITQELVDRVRTLAESQGLAPDTPAQWAAVLGEPPRAISAALNQLVTGGHLVRVTEDQWVGAEHARDAVERVLSRFAEVSAFSTGELKELLGLTRKHLIPFAEWLDAQKVTVRDIGGNRRVRAKARDSWLTQSQGQTGS